MQGISPAHTGAAPPPAPLPTIVPELPEVPPARAADDRLVFDAVTYARPLGFRPLLMDVHVPGELRRPPRRAWSGSTAAGGGKGDRRFPRGEPGRGRLAGSGCWPRRGWRWPRPTTGSRARSRYPAQLADAQAAIRFLRHRANLARCRSEAHRRLWGVRRGAPCGSRRTRRREPGRSHRPQCRGPKQQRRSCGADVPRYRSPRVWPGWS